MDIAISPVDMAKIGQLYLNKGIWNGKQIVSEKWAEESTGEHSRWKKHDLSYGYLWWANEHGYAAMRDGRNTIYVNTRDKLVLNQYLDSLRINLPFRSFYSKLKTPHYNTRLIKYAIMGNGGALNEYI